ncbi:MAG: NADH-quinone oxidoreductase subunit L [Clostridiales bacterium]|jgi:NADH:ubiquinone oxidoreductase subunit 5 (subunit L)/multisubunit Na+/H+ antiporter MnhA subunit|nr:NADH-quinone oxidoreductase subunit L [Clostridiales bacterium]
MNELLMLACVGIPLAGAFFIPMFGKVNTKLRNALTFLFVFIAFICSVLLLPNVFSGTAVFIHAYIPLGLSFGFRADALSVFMAITSSLVSAIIVIYSFGYIKKYDNQNEYYLMISLFIGAMMGLVYSTNLIMLYLFWEITSFCSWRLIGFYRDKTSIKRANKAFIVTVLGAFVMLIGFIGIYAETGTFDIVALKGYTLPSWIVGLILVGILSKSATFPLHSWLPDAGVAPSPVTSLLHAAVLVKIGLFVYVRLFVVEMNIDAMFTQIVPTIAAISALISAGAALKATDIKRVIAYSTISQIAFILLGLSCGIEIGITGGLLYILAHSIAKGGLFLCAGIVEHALHTKDMNQMGGLIKTMPITAISCLFCALSVMGIPPFGGFFAKFFVINGIISSGQIVLGIIFIIGAVMTVLYLARMFSMVFLGEVKNSAHEGTKGMLASVVTLAVLSLAMGILINYPTELARLVGGIQ